MAISTDATETKSEIISYQQLRTFIGLIGFFLPFALVLGCYMHGDGNYSWQHSISHYYYSKMHIVFVCALCMLGGFLITYKGRKNDHWESRVSNIAGYCALGAASLPTQFSGFRVNANSSNQYLQLCKEVNGFWNSVHFGLAGLLFTCFVIFCLRFFQKPDGDYNTPEEKEKFSRRKRLYKICGWGIIVSMVCIGFFAFTMPARQGLFTFTTFYFETASLLFFGTAWLVKGSLFWKRYPVLKWLIKPLR